ncbi:Mob1/phocein [Flagelloscypha sp. PMI_526]|nr:Mob1/phocein [Flagelloscypha sp. PMI_526]
MSFFNSIGRRVQKNSATKRSASLNAIVPPVPPSPVVVPEQAVKKVEDSPLYLSSPFVDAALVKGNFKTIVMLPRYVDVMEWVAVNVYDFYTNLNEFYGVISEFCTTSSCTTMTAGPALSYTWINQHRKSVHLPAPSYIDYVLTWIQNLLHTPTSSSAPVVFPTSANEDFPSSFPTTIKHIYRQLLRVFAHIYHAHFDSVLHVRCEGHLNSLFAHFLAFGKAFELIEERDLAWENGKGVGIGRLCDRWREKGVLG